MAHESFEDEATAAIMNREFVNIKVDREERPDVDRVYMTFVQATTGNGGWPMSVWLTPDLKPFVGGTYFPPKDRFGQPAFTKVLERIAMTWKEKHEQISEQGSKIVDVLRDSQVSRTEGTARIDDQAFQSAYKQLEQSYDPHQGGFSVVPKFPRPVALNFLTRFYARDPNSGDGKRALEMALFTLRKMAAGGVHDHIGGGFHRYSVDHWWHVPHFEKMLYDQAQLATAFVDAFQITQDRQYAAVARDVLDYVARDMTSKNGGFFSAEDADSPVNSDESKEGAFYVWTEKEIDEALGEEAKIFKYHYGVQPHGNAPEGSDPQDEFRGKNILIQRYTLPETAKKFEKPEDEIRQSLSRSEKELLSIRLRRPRPHLDDKIIAGWNGLMISAYAHAAAALDEPRYLESAIRAAKFVRGNLYDPREKLLYRSYRNGRGSIEAFADDYAFVIQGMLDLYETSFDVEFLKFAVELQETEDRVFLDEKSGGYFSTSGTDKSVVLRLKDDNDSAEPAASSVSALNLHRLAEMMGSGELRVRGQKTIQAFAPTLTRFASAMPQMLVALDFSQTKPRQIVLAGKIDDSNTKALLAAVYRHFLPTTILLLADGGEGQKYLGKTNEAIRTMSTIGGKSAAYVCENFTCKAPVTDAKALDKLLMQ